MADTTDMPTISITQDYDEDVSDCQSDVGDFKATCTDLEDLDSNDEDGVQKKLIKNLKKTAKRGSPAVTDIEDFQDSNSEDEKSEGPPEIRISLKEYLDAGHTEEKTQLSNKITSRSDSTVKEEEVTAGTKVVFEGQPTLFEPDEGDIDYVRYEVANLVDSILEQSVMIVNAQQCNDYNSESEHYAITCDVNGFDMVKSPTIESLSGKSFDDNMSVNDDNNTVNVPPLITTTTDIVTTSSSVDRTDRNENNRNFVNDQSSAMPRPSADVELDMNRSEKKFDRIERKFERLSSQLDDLEESAVRFDTDFDSMLSKDDVSNLQSDFSKISWDESASGTTTAADVGLSTPDNDLQDLPTGGDSSPEPKQDDQKK